MLKRILMRAGIGFLIGMVIGNLIAILTGNANSGGERFTSLRLIEMAGGSEAVAMILQSLFSGMYGAVCFAGMTFYEIERMPLAAATFSHCALIIILFILIGLLLGWLNKANGTDGSSICSGDCSGCRKNAGCSERKP